MPLIVSCGTVGGVRVDEVTDHDVCGETPPATGIPTRNEVAATLVGSGAGGNRTRRGAPAPTPGRDPRGAASTARNTWWTAWVQGVGPASHRSRRSYDRRRAVKPPGTPGVRACHPGRHREPTTRPSRPTPNRPMSAWVERMPVTRRRRSTCSPSAATFPAYARLRSSAPYWQRHQLLGHHRRCHRNASMRPARPSPAQSTVDKRRGVLPSSCLALRLQRHHQGARRSHEE